MVSQNGNDIRGTDQLNGFIVPTGKINQVSQAKQRIRAGVGLCAANPLPEQEGWHEYHS